MTLINRTPVVIIDPLTGFEAAVGTNGLHVVDPPFATKITVSGSYTYVGIAAPGTAQATAKWQCSRIDKSVSGTTIITWADGSANFDQVATDLTILTYL